jgi:hypothetical protein
MIPKSLTTSSSDWDVLKFRNVDSSFIKDNAHPKRFSTGSKRKHSNFNEFLQAVGSKLSDSKGPYKELEFKPSFSSTPKYNSRPRPQRDEARSVDLLRQRSVDTLRQENVAQPKQNSLRRRSMSTGNLPTLSPLKSEALDVLDQILMVQETLTIKEYSLNNCRVKVLVIEDTEL